MAFIEKNMMNISELVSDFNSLLTHANAIIDKPSPDATEQRDTVLATLFDKILGCANATRILLDNHCPLEAQIIVRSNLEALFYMGACLNSDEALKDFVGRDTLNELKYVNTILNDPDFMMRQQVEEKKAEFLEAKANLEKKIKNDDLKILSVEKAAAIAGVHSFYIEYRLTSESVHPTPNYLLEAFTEYDDSGIHQINILPNPKGRNEDVLLTTNAILALACDWYRNAFKIARPEDIKKVEGKYFQSRAEGSDRA